MSYMSTLSADLTTKSNFQRPGALDVHIKLSPRPRAHLTGPRARKSSQALSHRFPYRRTMPVSGLRDTQYVLSRTSFEGPTSPKRMLSLLNSGSRLGGSLPERGNKKFEPCFIACKKQPLIALVYREGSVAKVMLANRMCSCIIAACQSYKAQLSTNSTARYLSFATSQAGGSVHLETPHQSILPAFLNTTNHRGFTLARPDIPTLTDQTPKPSGRDEMNTTEYDIVRIKSGTICPLFALPDRD